MLDTPEGDEMYVEVKSVTLAEPLPGTPGLASPFTPPRSAHHSLPKTSTPGTRVRRLMFVPIRISS